MNLIKKYGTVFYLSLIQFFILVISLISSGTYDGSSANGFLYFFFHSFAFFIPGFALCIKSGLKFKRISYCIAFVCFFGLIVLIFEYYLLALIGLSFLSSYFAIVISGLSLLILYKNRNILTEYELKYEELFPLAILPIILLICHYGVLYANPLPEKVDSVVYNKDFLFWVGNSISFTKGLPVQNFRLFGQNFYYHYFSNIIIAQSSLITGIDVARISFCYSYIIPSIFLSFSCFYLLDVFLKRKIFVLIGMLMIFFTEGSTTFLMSHLYFCSFGFDYGFATAMLGIGFLYSMYIEDSFDFRNMLISCLIIMMNTGMKGPISIVTLIVYGLIALEMLITKKWKKAILCGLCWLISFLFIYLFFLSDITGKVEQTNGLQFLGILGAFDANRWAIEIFVDLTMNKGYPDNGISRIIALFLYVFRSNRFAMILLIIGGSYLLYSLFIRKEKKFFLLYLIILCLWGILLTINTMQDGNSQMYFIMSAFPFACLSGLYALDQAKEKRMIVSLIVIALAIFMSREDILRAINERIKTQIENSISVYQGKDIEGDLRYRFTKQDYEMSVWLKENSGNKDLIAIDCFEYDNLRKEEGFGVFSERFIWDDGQYSNEKITKERRRIAEDAVKGNKDALKQLKDADVAYLVQTLSQNPEICLDQKDIIYQNQDYVVFKID